jgi:hypothetical protein
MIEDPLERLHLREREEERRRMRELEEKDEEVSTYYGARPLEGFAGGHTTWTGRQDDEASAREYSSYEEEPSQTELEHEERRSSAPPRW